LPFIIDLMAEKMGKKAKYRHSLLWFAFGALVVLTLFSFFIIKEFTGTNIKATGLVIGEDLFTNIMIPATLASIVFSLFALATVLYLIYRIRHRGVNGSFPFKAYLAAVVMIFVMYAISYFVTLLPYGNLSVIVLTFILQIMVYGILLPYILVAHIFYIVLLLRGNSKDIFK